MNNIGLVTGFFAYLPGADTSSELLSRVAHDLKLLGMTVLEDTRYVLAVATPDTLSLDPNPDILLDVFSGTAVSSRLTSAKFSRSASSADIHEKAENVAQCYNLLKRDDTSFTLASDMLGLKPVYRARTHGGDVLGSRIEYLLRLFPELARPADLVGLQELMTFWAPLAGRTLHRKIRRTLPGGEYCWRKEDGLKSRRARDLAPVTVDALRFPDEMAGQIVETARQALLDKVTGAGQPAIMALSGGFDSRFIAALLQEHGIDTRAFSFGLAHHQEWHSAREVARALDMQLERLPYPVDNTFDHIAAHLEATEGTADPAALSIMPLLKVASAPGAPLLHGFCGDLQAGSHIERFAADDFASREAVAEAVYQRYYAPGQKGLSRLFKTGADPDAVREDILAGLKRDCPPHQAYMLWYLENRNRRLVGSQFALLGHHFDPILPLYDRRLFDLWHSVPPIGLYKRTLFRTLLAQHYPRLARIAHPDEVSAILPNLRQQLNRFSRQLPRRVASQTIGTERARELFLRLHRHDDILSLSKLAAPQQRARMLARIGELRPDLQEAFGIELEDDYEQVLASHLQLLRSLFFAGEYARVQTLRRRESTKSVKMASSGRSEPACHSRLPESGSP